MKLYTEDQVKRAMLHSYLTGVERPPDYLSREEAILSELTPIELPSDEQIEGSCHIMSSESVSAASNFLIGAYYYKDQVYKNR